MNTDDTLRKQKRAAGVREAYDAWAPLYESDGNPLVAIDDDIAPALWPRCPPPIPGHEGEALDLGCGTGRHTRTLVARGWRVTGADVSPGMLARARTHLPAQVELAVIEPHAPLPFASGSFDLVSCTLVLEHVEHLAPTLAEIARVLRPHGHTVITDIHPAMRARTQANFTDPATGDDVLPPSFLHTADDYRAAADAAGLTCAHASEHVGTEELVRKTARASKYLGAPMLLAFAFVKPAAQMDTSA